jgi:hypothetical protein
VYSPEQEWTETATPTDRQLTKELKRLEKEGFSPNTPLTFPSCNFDTSIAIDGKGNIIVDTCNNHEFDELSMYHAHPANDDDLIDKDDENFDFIDLGKRLDENQSRIR